MEISGKISGEALAADEGFFSSQGTLTKTGAGTLVISNGNNDYTGGNIVNGGILRLAGLANWEPQSDTSRWGQRAWWILMAPARVWVSCRDQQVPSLEITAQAVRT
ncbi:autotransporter-associated beta strand repeat-containing protein [Verrucomicrobium spinosum]|uniref:autotransporter-associated beta strand repeat-containing protein n=1 Tax=Verrucomicrobium spinosum TaxID=2736 RepID=UPI0031B62BD2